MRSVYGVFAVALVACTTAAPRAAAPTLDFDDRGDPMNAWAFDVHGLPAADASGAIAIADRTNGLTIRWMRPASEERAMTVLDHAEAARVCYDLDEDPVAVAQLAAKVRRQRDDVQRVLATTELRPLVPCTVDGYRLVCDSYRTTLDLARWEMAPQAIGDGPPKAMVTLLDEAHYDPETKRLAVRIEHRCKEPGSDACFLPESWHVVDTR